LLRRERKKKKKKKTKKKKKKKKKKITWRTMLAWAGGNGKQLATPKTPPSSKPNNAPVTISGKFSEQCLAIFITTNASSSTVIHHRPAPMTPRLFALALSLQLPMRLLAPRRWLTVVVVDVLVELCRVRSAGVCDFLFGVLTLKKKKKKE
jgi:hypothetical protein